MCAASEQVLGGSVQTLIAAVVVITLADTIYAHIVYRHTFALVAGIITAVFTTPDATASLSWLAFPDRLLLEKGSDEVLLVNKREEVLLCHGRIRCVGALRLFLEERLRE